MKKKIFKSLLAIACLLCSISASAYDFEVDGIYYDVVSLSDFTCKVVSGGKKYEGDVVIPATVNYANRTLTVVEIASGAFSSGLTAITIPNTISSISDKTFNGCSKLESVVIEDGKTYLSLGCNYYNNGSGKGLFYDCPITTLYIGRNLSYGTTNAYGRSPFYGIKTIKELKIGNSVSIIGENAFSGCSSLTNLTMGDSISEIKEYAFSGCSNLTNLIINDAVSEIGEYAFNGCSGLTNITIGNSATSIGNYAFYNCQNLTSIIIPNSITTIGKYAFGYCNGLTSVTIGNSISKIGENAFHNCSNLIEVHILDLNAWCKIEFSDVYSNPLYYAKHLYMNGEETKDLVIPDPVTSIGFATFYNCIGLTSVAISNSVAEIGISAFANCSELTSATIGNSVAEIGASAFSNCSGLTNVILGNSISKIGWNAFKGCKNLIKLRFFNTTPPKIVTTFYVDESFTNNQYMTLNVFVPQEALEAYQSADPWKNFWNLQGFDASGIENVKAEGGNAVYYDLRGNRLDAPKNGLNIINGKKMIMK